MKATPAQIAAYVGKSERTIHRYLASGKWPHTKLPGGLIEIDDALLLGPESEQENALIARLARIEQKLDDLTAHVAMLSQTDRKPPVRLHLERSEYHTPAQGELPPGLVALSDYVKEKGYKETTVRRWIDKGEIPVVTGRWKRGGSVIKVAIDEEGKRAMDRLFSSAG